MTTGREYSRGGGGGRIRKHRYKKIGGTMIKECRFMEDAHLSAAGSQASIPPRLSIFIEFAVFPVHRFARFVSPGATIEIINGTTETSFRCGSSILSFVSLRICISIPVRAKNHRSKERCWSMIVKVKVWNDVSLFSKRFRWWSMLAERKWNIWLVY